MAPLFGITISLIAAWAGHARADTTGTVRLERDEVGVVLETDVVRVELPKALNYHPAALIDKRSPGPSLVDHFGFSFRDVLYDDWTLSTVHPDPVSVRTGRDETSAWCEAGLLISDRSGRTNALLVRTTVFAGSPAVQLDLSARIPSPRIESLSWLLAAREYTEARWAARGETRVHAMTRAPNAFYPIVSLKNWLFLSRGHAADQKGIILFYNQPWHYRPPTLREKRQRVNVYHGLKGRHGDATLVLVPFSGPGIEAVNRHLDQWGRPEGIDFGGEVARQATGPVYTATETDRRRGYIPFVVPPFASILPRTEPLAEEVGAPMRLFACPGEYEPASFAIHAFRTLEKVTVDCGDLVCGDEIFPSVGINVRVVKVWAQAGYPDGDCGLGSWMVPELLLKDDTVIPAGRAPIVRLSGPVTSRIPVGETRQFLLNLQVPDAQPAGIYRGSVEFRAEGAPPAVLPLELRVLPFRLRPPRKHIGIWYLSDLRPGPDHVPSERMTAELINIREHGFSVVTHRGRGEAICRKTLECHRRAGLEGPLIFSNWFPSSSSPEDIQRLRNTAHALARDIAGYGHVYFQGCDEPNNREETERARAYFGRIQAVGGKTFVNLLPQTAVALGDLLDLPCVVSSAFFGWPDEPRPPDHDKVEALQRLLIAGKPVWYYWPCNVENPRQSRLLFGFLLMKSEASGVLPWVYYVPGVQDPYDDWSTGNSYRAGGIVYPSRDGPVDTIQWEAAREGVDDCRYVTTLQDLIRRAERRTSLAGRADEARKKLSVALARVSPRIYEAQRELTAADLQEIRADIAETCVSLHTALKESAQH